MTEREKAAWALGLMMALARPDTGHHLDRGAIEFAFDLVKETVTNEVFDQIIVEAKQGIPTLWFE